MKVKSDCAYALKKSMKAVTIALLAIGLYACTPGEKKVVSPDGKISLSVQVEDSNEKGYGKALFSIDYTEGEFIKNILSNAVLGMETGKQKFDHLKLLSVSEDLSINENYRMITGKKSHCTNRGVERTYRFENEQQQILQVVFRVYDNGVAFRYILDAAGPDAEFITDEFTTYHVPDGTKRWMQQYVNDYEGFFPLSTTGGDVEERNPHTWGYPALIEPQEQVFMLISEAGITRNQSASRLVNSDNRNEYRVRMADEKVAFSDSFCSPWRVLIIGSLADVVESTLVTDVSEPNKVADTDWIIPGAVAWIYWAHNHSSKDFQVVKEYIDLATRMKWPYDLIDWEWDVMANGGNIQDAIKYAHDKGVKPMLWYNSGTSWLGPGAPGPLDRLNTKENREKEFAWLKESGVAGIKVDFFGVDGAEIINYYIDILEDAAKYQLLINFHGATVPRGWQRTYPHMMTVEAVYGAEWYNNNPILTDRAAAHNATLPFTRNVIGPMDYTPGTFSDSQHPHITSNAHELALPVVFESALQHMPDKPSVYDSLPDDIKELLSGMPTTWDDTRLLNGYPGIDVIIARRKGEVWYIGGLNGTDDARTLSFTPASLSAPGKTITLFKDGADDRSFAIEKATPLTDANRTIEVKCLPRGGFTAIIF